MLTIQRAVQDFIARSKGLYQQLRSDGGAISDVDLVSLREQLHILDREAGELQERKEFESELSPFVFDGKRSHTVKPLNRRSHS